MSASKELTTLLYHHKILKHFKQIHSFLITHGLSDHTFFLTKRLHSPTLYQTDHIETLPSTIHLWNTIISGFSISFQPQKSLLYYTIMRRIGILPDNQTYNLLLKSYPQLENRKPFDIYAHIVKYGLDFDNSVTNSLITAFSNCGCVQFAHQVLDESPHRNLVTWTAMIDGYVRNGFPVDGIKCFKKMRSMGVKIDEITVVSVLCAAGMAGDVWFGRWVHGFYVESGRVKWDVYIGSSLLDMYCKCGYCDDACKLFNEMPVKNIVCWSALIAGYVQCNRFKDALLLFQDMLLTDVRPNQCTLSSVLTASAQLGALDRGRWVHDYIDRNSLEMNSILGTALIDMYAKCGCISEAYVVFNKLHIKNVYTWTAMINGLAMHGDALSSLNLFSHMISNGVQPNGVTFVGILNACAHGGLVHIGRGLFDMMKHMYNLEPNVDHYGCMVDLLGRAGYLEDAIKLIEDMPVKPTPGVWGALFGACMIHKAFNLGEYVGNLLIRLQPSHSGRYALLANMYSEYGKWDAAAHVRKIMKGKGIEKKPGHSWIEVNGLVRKFIAFDGSHSESCDLYDMLNNIMDQLKLADHLPETKSLTFDIVTFDA
ncbi:pentatricopeptide repeat-containing protein At1g50270 [Ricinus communis]|uniref:pentatricopeptide repeat-containing protein At1g50270 n=1 Tax=Ricinus communis TaxID=3988 RepID=UPI00201AC20F|nr:pentatricopeptide repeat-containing protein At1g50270 [Ricinus communis]XP_015573437.2 pentatricopeptide repeat-containing protein At1g50270 [Ricinus communis]